MPSSNTSARDWTASLPPARLPSVTWGAELGATCSIFPFDQNASEYLRKTGREEIASLAQMNAAELRADDEIHWRARQMGR